MIVWGGHGASNLEGFDLAWGRLYQPPQDALPYAVLSPVNVCVCIIQAFDALSPRSPEQLQQRW